MKTYLESLVLEYFLDGYFLFLLGHVEEASGKDDSKRAIANDFTVCVLDLSWVPSFTV